MTPQTLPIQIGGKATLPSGTVIEILGIHNGQVGMIVTECNANGNGQAAKRPRKQANGNGSIIPPVTDPLYWQEFRERQRKSMARWKRKYRDLDGWLAANPDKAMGRQIDNYEFRARGFAPTALRLTDGMRAAYDRWEERWIKLQEAGAAPNNAYTLT